jgi:hypothetical protein
MRYEGVVKTDTHQQESEIAVLEIETDGEDVTGRFACHYFDTKAVHVEVEGERARIFAKRGGPVVVLQRKD